MVMTRRGQLPFTEFHNCLQYFQRKVFDPFLKDPCPSEEEADEDLCNYLRSLNLATLYVICSLSELPKTNELKFVSVLACRQH